MNNVILLADNQEEDRTTWQRILISAGFDVELAKSPDEIREVFRRTKVDVAIIDLRLVDDENQHDISGLLLAKENAYRHIPKIILTAYNTGYSEIREVLGPIVDELPSVVAFVKKDERPDILIEIIRQTIRNWPRIKISITKVSEQIKSDHADARRQARFNYMAAFGLSIFGSVVMFSGIALAWLNMLTIGVVATTGGILVEVLGYLFFTRVDLANQRMDGYHQELLQTNQLEYLLAISEELPTDKRATMMERAVRTAIDNWLGSSLHLVPRPMIKKRSLKQQKTAGNTGES